jgi:RNA polymerase sigma factor (sigma-70 family)
MATLLPAPVSELLRARSEEARTRAWESFVQEYSRLLYVTARRSARGHDEAMDRYAFVLAGLRADDYRRIRAFREGGRTRFTTFLVVITSRLCVDHHRQLYGRYSDPAGEGDGHAARRDLVDLVGDELALATLPADTPAPDHDVRIGELREALDAALTSLEDEERLLLRLRFEDQTSVRDIARVLGLPSEFHVYRRLQGVLRNLKSNLERRGVLDPRP